MNLRKAVNCSLLQNWIDFRSCQRLIAYKLFSKRIITPIFAKASINHFNSFAHVFFFLQPWWSLLALFNWKQMFEEPVFVVLFLERNDWNDKKMFTIKNYKVILSYCGQIFDAFFWNYRSRQYYESKVLHNTEVTWFSTFHGSLTTNYFDKNSYRMS